MERESFSSSEVAARLNRSFVPIKVDREERPDVDDVYMNYVQATTGSGGWPLNVFLTPDLEPVFGGTYWPGPHATRLPGLGEDEEEPASFVGVLTKMAEVWATQERRCKESAREITYQLRDFAEEGDAKALPVLDGVGDGGDVVDGNGGGDEDLDLDLLEQAFRYFAGQHDAVHGGFVPPGGGPKFPTPAKLAFLLRLAQYPSVVADVVGAREVGAATMMVTRSLAGMWRGGIRDHVGHGFARYSVTADWGVPHFEKMVVDQAQLLSVYADTWSVTGDPEMLEAAVDLVEYLTERPVLTAAGGFASSEDADSPAEATSIVAGPLKGDKREGAFYTWTLRELHQILGPRDADVVAHFYSVRPDGNVPRVADPHDELVNQNILATHRAVSESDGLPLATPVPFAPSLSALARDHGLPGGGRKAAALIASARRRLRAHREAVRIRPAVDDKVVAGTNGLVIDALACASLVFDAVAEGDGGGVAGDAEEGVAGLSVEEARVLAARCRRAAEGAAEFIRRELWEEEQGKLWRIYYGAGAAAAGGSDDDDELVSGRADIAGFAEDYAYLAKGLISLYQATFDDRHLRFADQLQGG